MKKNVFLTGEKGSGKTTAIKKYLSSRSPDCGGFVTVRAVGEDGKEAWLHLMGSYDEVPSEENALFCLEEGRADAELIKRSFDERGCAVLAGSEEKEIIIMDELGPREEEAQLFHDAVIRCLGSCTPVLGVLQKAESVFLDSIKERSDTVILNVDETNRDTVPGLIADVVDACSRVRAEDVPENVK